MCPAVCAQWNDGFAGNNVISGNLVFNMVRETGDHVRNFPIKLSNMSPDTTIN